MSTKRSPSRKGQEPTRKHRSQSLFWQNILRAAETQPREVKALRGFSGFSHPANALGIDEARRRVVIVSAEGDARTAFMAQGDIQATMPSLNVIMVRPVAINFASFAKIVADVIGGKRFGQEQLAQLSHNPKEFQARVDAVVENLSDKVKLFSHFSAIPLNMFGVIKEALQQLTLIETIPAGGANESAGPPGSKKAIPTFDFGALTILDPVEADRQVGVCSVPLYELSDQEVERLNSRPRDEEARDILRRLDILQYFFPAADQLALGLVDRDHVNAAEVVNRLEETPHLGHPFGPHEIIDPNQRLVEVVDELQERGLLVKGESAVEITSEGCSVRSKVCFRPREGLLSKLLKRLSVKIDLSLKDLFSGPGQ